MQTDPVPVRNIGSYCLTRISALVCLWIACLPPSRIIHLFPSWVDSRHTLSQFYKYLFALGLIGLLTPIAQTLYSLLQYDLKSRLQWFLKRLLESILITGILFLLIWPWGGIAASDHGLVGLAKIYGWATLSPFDQADEYTFRRILAPAVSHFLWLRGPGLYFVFTLFSILALVLVLNCALNLSIARASQDKTWLQSPFWRLLFALSLSTSSFVIVQLQWIGYPEQWAFAILLLALLLPLNGNGRIAISSLALITHDAAAFTLLPLIFFVFPKPERKEQILLLTIMAAFWALSYGFDLKQSLILHDVIGKRSHFHELIDRRDFVASGVFSTFKWFWIGIIAALWIAIRGRMYREFFQISGSIIAGFAILLIAWDVSRMMNFSFLAIFFALPVVLERLPCSPPPWFRAALAGFLTLNFVWPTQNVLLYYPWEKAQFPYLGIYSILNQVLSSLVASI